MKRAELGWGYDGICSEINFFSVLPNPARILTRLING